VNVAGGKGVLTEYDEVLRAMDATDAGDRWLPLR